MLFLGHLLTHFVHIWHADSNLVSILNLFHGLYQQRPQRPLNAFWQFIDWFCSNSVCRKVFGNRSQFVSRPSPSKAKQRRQRPLKISRPFIDQNDVQIVYRPPFSVCFVAFTIKGQKKAAAAFKGITAIYWPIPLKFGMQIAYRQPFSVYFMAFTKKVQTKAAVASKVSLLFIDWFSSNLACS